MLSRHYVDFASSISRESHLKGNTSYPCFDLCICSAKISDLILLDLSKIPSMSASSTSSLDNKHGYDVFVSFYGPDTRFSFVDYLYEATKQHGIRTFKDDEMLQKGEIIASALMKAIEDSSFFIIVFSKNYAASTWCLEELAMIMELHKTGNHRVIPLFYDVDPTDVRKQTRAVGEAIARHDNEIRVMKWREALKQAADLYGYTLKDVPGGGPYVIRQIIKQISLESKVYVKNSSIGGEYVGMETRIKDFMSLSGIRSDDTVMIGIKGMGGGGKTALARAIFDGLSIHFEGKSFVENVREVSKASLSGLMSLQEKVLSDVFNVEDIKLSSVVDGKVMMKRWLRGKKVLIVLDDVDHISQLEALADESNWFKPGSRILITTRDEQVLIAHQVKVILDVNLLSDNEAICLFNRYAFGRETAIQGNEELSRKAVRYAAGHPLTLKVLGSFLRGKDMLEWSDALERLKTIPLKETIENFNISYISLEDDYKEMFLDVACLLKGWQKDDAIRVLESCGFHARNGLKVLEQKSLLTISNDKCLDMHDHIQEMGRYITRRLYPDNPSKHSRLWIREEIEDVLADDLGNEATRAIVVDTPLELNSISVTEGLGNMKKLRLLCVVSEIDDESKVKIDQVSQNFPNAIRFLRWVGYPHCSLPRTFRTNNLVALEMPHSRMVQLWEGGERKVLRNLRFLNLRNSLLGTLDLGMTPNLERLDLEDCYDLKEIRTPISCPKLVFLNFIGCQRIDSFLFLEAFESLKVLCLGRLNLKEFPNEFLGHNNSLLELRFSYNDIKKLPSSIGKLQKLVYLDLHSCINLGSLPGSICDLQHLRNLKLQHCILEELPEDIGRLECLEKLNLSFTRIKRLPDSFCMLKNLKILNLTSCCSLEKLPADLDRLESLETLILTDCTRVRHIPDSICMLKYLKYLSVMGCVQLDKLPDKVGSLCCLEVLDVKNTFIRHLPRSIFLLRGLIIHQHKSVLQTRGYPFTSGTLEPSLSTKNLKIDHVQTSPQEK